MKKQIILALMFIIVVLMAITIVTYFFLPQKKEVEIAKNTDEESSQCLDGEKEASYKIEKREVPLADIIISINNKSTEKEISSFKINSIRKNYYPIELRRCGVYVIKMLNYDSKKTQQEPGYKAELWKYNYSGYGAPIVLFHETTNENNIKIYKSYYSTDFRVSPNERYLVFEKEYLGKEDYSLVIKDLKIKDDKFILFAKDIVKQYPNVVGSFGLDQWSQDGRYFWGDIFDGAYSLAYFRIDVNNWSYDIFEAPNGSMGGMPLNINTGYLPIQPGLVWTGDVELTQELKEKDRKEGKKSILYLYNLFTKEQKLLETTNEPQFFFKPQWLSDTELEYELPTGEKKVYKINEK